MSISVLSHIAHIDRCLFPNDFMKELILLGMGRIDAYSFSKYDSIVKAYQASLCGSDKSNTLILDQYVSNWIDEFKRVDPRISEVKL